MVCLDLVGVFGMWAALCLNRVFLPLMFGYFSSALGLILFAVDRGSSHVFPVFRVSPLFSGFLVMFIFGLSLISIAAFLYPPLFEF